MRQARTASEAEQLLQHALATWQRPGDAEWGASLGQQIIRDLQTRDDALQQAEDQRRRLYDLTPHGHNLTMFQLDQDLDKALLANDTGAITRYSNQVDDSPAAKPLRLKFNCGNSELNSSINALALLLRRPYRFQEPSLAGN